MPPRKSRPSKKKDVDETSQSSPVPQTTPGAIGPPVVVVETPTRTSRGKRKSSSSVIQHVPLDAEDDISEDDEDLQPVLESPFTQQSTQQSTPKPRYEPNKKRLKTTARAPPPPRLPTIVLDWVPINMKVDILKANERGNLDDVYSCVRWYIRVICLVKRDLTTEDRQKLVMLLFGLGEAQVQLVENSTVGDKKEHFGVKVGRKIKHYYNGLMEIFRKRFDALLTMFWKSKEPDVKQFIEGRLMIWKVVHSANARRNLGRLEADESSTPIIYEDEVNEWFLKENMKLVHDVWSTILDVVDTDFMLKNEDWNKVFLKSTSIILAWMITYTFRLENPEEAIKTALATGITPLSPKNKSTCIMKGDLQFTGYPNVNRPESWSGKRGGCSWYGELEGSKAIQEQVEEEVDNDLKEEMKKVEEVSKGPEPPEGLNVEGILDTSQLESHSEFLLEQMKRKADAYEALEKRSIEKRLEIGGQINKLQQWMQRSKVYQEKTLKNREAETYILSFLAEVEKQYLASEKEERASAVEMRPMNAQVPSSLSVMGTLQVWLKNLKEQEWFIDCLKAYKTSIENTSRTAYANLNLSNLNPMQTPMPNQLPIPTAMQMPTTAAVPTTIISTPTINQFTEWLRLQGLAGINQPPLPIGHPHTINEESSSSSSGIETKSSAQSPVSGEQWPIVESQSSNGGQ